MGMGASVLVGGMILVVMVAMMVGASCVHRICSICAPAATLRRKLFLLLIAPPVAPGRSSSFPALPSSLASRDAGLRRGAATCGALQALRCSHRLYLLLYVRRQAARKRHGRAGGSGLC